MGEAARRGQRGVAVAGGDVEHEFVGAHVGRFGEHFADNLQRRADDGVVAAGPGGLLALLDRGIVRRRGSGVAGVAMARVMMVFSLKLDGCRRIGWSVCA